MKWQIKIPNFLGGFAPAWYKETYPSYGNKNQLGTMTNIDLTNPGYMTQGPGLSNLTNGTQAAAFTTLMKGATDHAVTSDVAYGVGGAKLYKFSSTAVTSDGTWPHTIDKAAQTAEDGEDVCHFQGALYYSYNHSNTLGDIGKFDLNATFDDDWGSTVPTGAATLTGGVPHQMIAGGNDTMYVANGRYVTSYDGTTFVQQALDLPSGSVIQSLAWTYDKLWIAATNPNLTGSNKQTSSIYLWDGTTTSWDLEIKLMGTVGALHVRNGILFVFYQEITSTGGYKLGYIDGARIVDVANFTGGLPAYYQVTDYKDFILWNSNGSLWCWGSGDKDLPVHLFQIADGGYATVGTVVCPFGMPIVASTESTNYKVAKFSGYDVVSSAKSLMFDITGKSKTPGGRIECVRFNYEAMASGARVDWKLLNNQGTTLYTDTISFAKIGNGSVYPTTAWFPINAGITDTFRVELDYANGSATNAVAIKNVTVYGDTD